MSESQNNSILVSLYSKLYGSAVHNNSEDENKQSSEPFKFLSNPRIAVEIFIWGFISNQIFSGVLVGFLVLMKCFWLGFLDSSFYLGFY